MEIPGEDWSNKVAITGDTKAKACGNNPKVFSFFFSFVFFFLDIFNGGHRAADAVGEERRRAPEQSNCLSFQFPLSLLQFILLPFFLLLLCSPFFFLFLSPPRRFKLFCEEKKNNTTEMTLHFTQVFLSLSQQLGKRHWTAGEI